MPQHEKTVAPLEDSRDVRPALAESNLQKIAAIRSAELSKLVVLLAWVWRSMGVPGTNPCLLGARTNFVVREHPHPRFFQHGIAPKPFVAAIRPSLRK
jgi:hypothetical protein